MKLTIETRDVNTFLTANLGEQDAIDEFDFGMIKNNTIQGLIPAMYLEIDGTRKFKYNITSTISLKRFLAGEISRKTFLNLLRSFQKSFAEQQEYMMKQEYVLLDYEHVFINPAKEQVCLVCIPVTSIEKEQNLGSFFKDLLFHAKYRKNEDNTYVAELINFLSTGKGFSLECFGGILDEMIMKSQGYHPKQKEYIFQGEMINKFEKPAKEYKMEVKEPDVGNSEKKNSGLNMGFHIPDNKFMNEQEINGDNEGKKGFSLFGKKKKTEAGEYKRERVERAEKVKPTLPETDVAIKGYEVNREGKLVPCDGRKGIGALPYLIRVSTNEKIQITGEVFRIGRGRRYTNYCIMDNPEVGRNHADIVKSSQGYKIIDNNSKNHTYINGTQIASECPIPLEHGMTISLSGERFIFCLY